MRNPPLIVAALLAMFCMPVMAEEPPNVPQIRKDFLEAAKRAGGDPSLCLVTWDEPTGLLAFECSDKPYRCFAIPNPDKGNATIFLLGCEERAPGSATERKL